ncbi:protein-glutamate methylesterase/protein-glutamine glutaminase [Ideonella margarita]|uniref:Protein-glutamate methylesterase/protein-glutamine glutaminase n=1 Tax=Ideonella margarita TaxID=2984191 RepID=A0ABU9C779_9BURK
MPNNKIKVMLVDDSAVVRTHLSNLMTAAGFEVIATASDPLFAWPKMQTQWPDVLVLDVEMPRMDGISFLRQVMAHRPTPVVMCSTLTLVGCETTLQALAAGAVSFVTKPTQGLRDFLGDGGNGLVDAVRAAAKANLRAMPVNSGAPALSKVAGLPGAPGLPNAVNAPGSRLLPPVPGSPAALAARQMPMPAATGAMAATTDKVIALGLSTGGVQTMEALLTQLPRTTPGIVLVQHMPEQFTASLAARLNGLCEMDVAEARDGDRVLPGRVLIAPGGKHMRLERSGAQYLVKVADGPLVNRHKPSVDVLFKSVAQSVGRNAVGILLTGMGDDGARGLLEMKQAGAQTAAQDEASSVVWGMPAEAIKLGAAGRVLGLQQMPAWLAKAAVTG